MTDGNPPDNVMTTDNKRYQTPKDDARKRREDARHAELDNRESRRALKAEMNALIGRIHDLEAFVICTAVVFIFYNLVHALFG